MRLLVLLSENPWARALGWSLMHFVWEGALVAALLAIGLKAVSGRSARLRYGLACGALLLMVLLPLATFGSLAMTSHAGRMLNTDLAMQRLPVMGVAGGFGASGSWREQIQAILDRTLPWFMAGWMCGVVVLLGKLSLGLMVARRMKAMTGVAVPAALQRVFAEVKARLSVTRSVRLAHSAMVQVPTVIGWLRPVVLIPVGCLTGLSPKQIEAVFAHELAHILRHDYLVSVLQTVVEAVLFYHPAVWWVSRQIRREREDCCDDLAVSVSGDSLAYARALSLLEEHRSAYPAVSLGANGGALMMRVKRLLGYEEAAGVSQLVGTTLLAAVVAGIAMGIVTVARAQSGADAKMTKQEAIEEASLPPLYRKWLDQDVVWIITPEERAEYLKLETEDERNRFIQQFWTRRNVKGDGSGNNAFRAEHYRRIAYANGRFSATDPGWKSDRGRIYIMYGPPDSIDSHPAAGEVKPWQVWHYNSIQEYSPDVHETQQDRAMTVTKKNVDMKFVDTCECGNFQLETDAK